MDTFLLWGATSTRDDETELSWFAAPLLEAGIGAGTNEMARAMLRDLGYQVPDVVAVRVRHLRTNYLDASRFGHAWEITATFGARVAELPLQGQGVHTGAVDATWSGAWPEPPSEATLLVDFDDTHVAERAERILRAVEGSLGVSISHRGHETAQLLASFGVVDEAFFAGGDPRVAKAIAAFEQLGARVSRR